MSSISTKRCFGSIPPFGEAPGYRSISSIRAGTRAQTGVEAEKIASEMTWKDYVEKGHIIAGSPATVRDRLREAVEVLRVGHLMVLLHIGSMPKDLTLKNLDLFSREVLPAVKDMWSGYEDHWWPAAVPDRVRAPSLSGD